MQKLFSSNGFFTFIFVFCISLSANAQHRSTTAPTAEIARPDTSLVDILTLTDGNEFVGTIKSINGDAITFVLLNASNEMTIQRKLVKYTRTISYHDYIAGYIIEHRGAPSLFGAHTAFTVPKGEGQYETMGFVVSNMYDYGVSKNVSIGAGLFGFLPSVRVKVGGKVAKSVYLAGGTTFATLPFGTVDFAGGGSSGIAPFFGSTYGVATFGSVDQFVNLNIGIAYTFGQPPISTFQLGGFTRITPKTAIFGEVNMLPGAIRYNTSGSGNLQRRDFVLANFGARLLQKQSSWDLGMVFINDPSYQSRFIFFPMVGFKAFVNRR